MQWSAFRKPLNPFWKWCVPPISTFNDQCQEKNEKTRRHKCFESAMASFNYTAGLNLSENMPKVVVNLGKDKGCCWKCVQFLSWKGTIRNPATSNLTKRDIGVPKHRKRQTNERKRTKKMKKELRPDSAKDLQPVLCKLPETSCNTAKHHIDIPTLPAFRYICNRPRSTWLRESDQEWSKTCSLAAAQIHILCCTL